MKPLFAASLALAVAAPAVAAPPAWKAGVGRVAITPDRPVWMSGYAARTAPAEGKDTDLWAKAMVLEDAAGKRLVLVTLDLVGIDRPVSQAACRLIEGKHKVGREAVALASSHTHCGPVVRGNLRSMYDLDEGQSKRVDEYGQKLPGLILEAVDKAAATLEPVTLSRATGTAGFAVNRRENKEPQVPASRAKGEALKGPTDFDVPVLAVRDEKGALKGVVFGYACHATVLSYQRWNADYPGYAAAGVEAAHPGATAMFFAGCGADQNPLPRKTVELAKEYGRQLAAAVGDVLARPMAPLAPRAAAAYREIALPLAALPSRDQLAQESQSPNKLLAGRAKMLLKRLDAGESLPTTYPYPVQTWRLGDDLTVVILGGEVVVDYALRLKKELPAGNTWVMGYANDVMAYIPSLRVLREGGYEGATSMVPYGLPTTWGPAVEEDIVAEAHRQVKAGGR